MYKGLSASVARELTFSTLVLSLYEPYKNLLGGSDPNASYRLRIAAGALAGMTSAIPTSPTDLLKVRMQADTGSPKTLRWHIRHVYRLSGLLGFYTGVKETIMFAGLRRGSSLSTYDHSKHLLLKWGWFSEGILIHSISSVIAGFATSLVTSPVDLIRTRLMNFKKG